MNQIRVIINSGAISIYISKDIIIKYKIDTKIKERLYDIITINGSLLETRVVNIEIRY